MRRQPFSRHAGFFSCLQRVEDRLASESEQQHQEQKESPPPPATAKATATTRQTEASPFSDTMTASPLLFLDPAAPAPAPGSSSGPALDFLTAATQEGKHIQQEDDDNDGGGDGDEEDIARLMELLGLSSGGGGSSRRDDDGGGCDCSGADGFLAKVVGVVGPKCDREKGRLDAWIRHYHRGGGREPARLAHLLLARAAADTAAVAFPASVKDFLDHDPPRQLTDESEWSDANGDNNRD
ncbi:hypothetical protein Zm00014a_036979 [Zea mays]|uniref:Uncharacterized protein n=2 Tax=Zea mays TaxID=4577 RepID=B6UBW2_MAIZE|nr:uncharacterized protein LOC100274944 [Zea mays]ACG46845.1 hypothetical protein [Zea mays]PWZ41422.1 hypothetical protein Zm00014a_036979 [Zea mays]|eukprot:NP_001309174.1 uncharacterized protein LOC100274944 [Zea mays]